MPSAAGVAALLFAATAAAAQLPQEDLLAAVADPAARQLLSRALREIESLRATPENQSMEKLLGQMAVMRGEMDSLKAGKVRSDDRWREEDREREEMSPQHEGSRRLQRTGDIAAPRAVHIYTRSMSMQSQQSAGPTRGRRRAEEALGGCWTAAGVADVIDVEGRTAEVHAACCGAPGNDCSSGMPSTCGVACAATLMDYWEDCAVQLRLDKAVYVEVHRAV